MSHDAARLCPAQFIKRVVTTQMNDIDRRFGDLGNRQRPMRTLGFKPGDFPNAEDYYARAISIPMYPTMTDEMQSDVIEAIRQAVAT